MLSLVALLAAACASAPHEVYGDTHLFSRNDRSIRAIGPPELPHGCMYEGRWFTEGTVVTTHEACLRCVCVHGALACRRRACASLPDPPPHRCHVLHRRGSCCPELHCPDGVTMMEHGASARFENDDFSDVATPASIVHACVEGGTVYSAGSAMESTTACEQCFCLGGARRCVRPRCLPPPAGCRARPSSGACCPQRYYCEHVSTRPPDQKHMHDCEVDGRLIPEGERALSAEASRNCTRCFCLRGSVRCQPLACAPPLLGCRPLLRPGQCCPHQYHCDHKPQGLVTPHLSLISDNALVSTRSNDRSFHPSKSNEIASTTKTVTTSLNTTKKASLTLTTKTSPVPTTKVKRKTNDPPPTFKHKLLNTTTTTISTTQKSVATTAIVSQTEKTTTEQSTEKVSTDQPEGSVKITVNGTINCTAELSSTSLPLNITVNDKEKINMEALPRVPDKLEIEAHTSSYPNDIITDRNVDGGFDENESFVINVTSSLTTNTSHSSPKPATSTFSKVTVPVDLVDAMNNSKKTKGEYDYDYTEPTLPPSLPNLKIIPFVAADAVVDEDVSSKETLSYPMLEREDKFPVYYPTAESKETPFARREDKFPPTQYPVFVSEKVEPYPPSSEDYQLNLSSASYPNAHNDLTQEYTVSTLIGNHNMEMNNAKKVTIKPASTTFGIKIPAVNLFSPPVETEGGFIPKGPEIIDEYYAVYPSTPPGPPVPHLTTSMQLDIKGECVTGDGRHISEGDSISLACSICTCAWGELHCSPRPCHTPAGCRRRPASNNAGDLCCGELVCDKDNKTTPQVVTTTERIKIDTSTPSIENKTEISINNTVQDTKLQITSNKTVEHNVGAFDNSTLVKVPNNTITKLEETTSNPNSLERLTSVPSTTTSTTTTTTTMTTPIYKESNETVNNSQEYDEEDEDDEGYFFGNVLKLILSDNYETTIAPYKKKSTMLVTVTEAPKITTPLTTTTRRPSPKPSIAPFIPMPHHNINYVPPKKSFQQNTVNRIDHLVLGEATAIKKTTPRPPTTVFKTKNSSFKPFPTNRPTTQRPFMTTRFTEATKVEPSVQYTPRPNEDSRPPSPSLLPGMGPGLLKLAGCNIYGRMYRVGRIIAELSTPCQECWCTELGVQCKQRNC